MEKTSDWMEDKVKESTKKEMMDLFYVLGVLEVLVMGYRTRQLESRSLLSFRDQSSKRETYSAALEADIETSFFEQAIFRLNSDDENWNDFDIEADTNL
eukprot:CAMPEP_0170157188 /NCGR_PEP_ID=MMETSP0033_2-20121228/65155_1 /TAXON_ID=195969 /ORGANISM="Dolichomastix tenuilepis, Strain CCMP3274" /LENGTH=98 /DNA_ID=CAMNT_0010394579 /DNA_START=208 /DNA_END=500 /DNA_ORIENTATION=-